MRQLSAAVEHWRDHRDSLQFVLNLGDIIDGQDNPATTQADFDRVSAVLDPLVSAGHCAALWQLLLWAEPSPCPSGLRRDAAAQTAALTIDCVKLMLLRAPCAPW